MKNANFTNLRTLFIAVIALFATAANAQMACNDNVQVSVDPTLDENCTVELSADAILEAPVDGVNYDIEVSYQNDIIVTGTDVVSFDANENLGNTLMVKIIDGNNSCWGTIVVEDKVAPECDAVSNYAYDCTETVPVIPPTFIDNCTPDEELNVQLIDEANFGTLCGGDRTIVRTWAATDASGNTSVVNCVQTITISQSVAIIPGDFTISCDNYATVQDIPVSVSGDVQNVDAGCMYSVTYSDVLLPGCGGLDKINRTWTVLNMCDNTVTTQDQLISLVDVDGPSISGSDVTLNANVAASHPNACASTEFIAAPSVTDNCSGVVSFSMFTSAGELDYVTDGAGNIIGGFIPAPGLGIGTHDLTITAEDVCGNTSEETYTITVVDGITPTTICKEFTTVTLTTDGTAVVFAESFDNGSYDNCCLDYFEVRRMDDNAFGPSVSFDCEDETVMVVFRAVDCANNFSDCMVEITVEDKMNPVVSCPANDEIDCDVYYTDFAPALDADDASVLEAFGTASIFDNCEFESTYSWSYNVDQCGEGSIVRTWTATDASNNGPASCTQTISIFHVSDWNVSFPGDFDGEVDADCNVGDIDFGAVTISNDECEMIAVNFTDTQFDVPGQDACFKIFREYTVINWCTYDVNNSNEIVATIPGFNYNAVDGDYVTYTQTIKVKDNVAPVVSVENFSTQVSATSCFATFAQADVDAHEIVDGCDTDVYAKTINYGDLAIYLNNITNNFENVPVGSYDVTFTVSDPCGNVGTTIKTVTVVEKAPTAYCTDELVIDLMTTGMAVVSAEDFNFASFDNCTPASELSYAFSSDINDTEMTVTCDNVGGNNPITMYVFDADGLTDFCAVNLVVQNNNGADCGDNPTVAGAINTDAAVAVPGVTVEINGGLFSATTTAAGSYEFTNISAGSDISIAPSLNDDITNGVTTFDIVKITQHILGIQTLDSAYKVIAADANRSNSVSTLDIVEIRKAILQISENFSNNTSWRFVDASHVFSDINNPWGFPEVVNFNNVDSAVEANFVAVKVGDVNGSAQVSMNAAQNRNAATININAADKAVQAGETVAVEFTTNEVLAGYQFSLAFAGLELVDVEYGVATEENFGFANVAAGVLTTSWNANKAVSLEGEALFTAVFVATENVQLSNALTINSKVIAAEAVTAELEAANVELAFDGAVANNFAVYQNTPNPFSAETVIGFNTVEAGKATVTFTSVEGKVLAVRTVEAAKGYNAITVNANEIAAAGVVYYTVETANNTATNKMVIVK